MSFEFILIVILVSLLIGLSKGGMGAVLVVLATPLMALVMPVSHAISVVLPLLLLADAFALALYWNTWEMRYVKLMLPLAVLGVILGSYLLAALPDTLMRPILGIFTLIFIVYKLADRWLSTLHYHPKDWHGYLAGFASGLGSALANTGAPPFTAYMLLQEVSPKVFVGTTTLFFAIVNALKIPGLVVNGLLDLNDLVGIAWALPLIPFGVWLGRWLVQRLNPVAFERFLLFALFIAAMILLFVPATR